MSVRRRRSRFSPQRPRAGGLSLRGTWGGWHANMRPLELALKNRRRARRDIGVLYMRQRRSASRRTQTAIFEKVISAVVI